MALESDENLYVKADLEDYANFSQVEDRTDSYSGPSRKTVLSQALGVNEDEIEEVREGGYQGTILFVVELGEYIWLIKDSYGSCSHCDGMLGAQDSGDYADYVRGMCRNAYAFESVTGAIEFLESKTGEGNSLSTFAYGWSPLVSDGIDILRNRS